MPFKMHSNFIKIWNKLLYTKGGVLYLVFYPRTCPRTSLQCFALGSRCSEAKHCRDVIGRVLG